MTGSSSDGLAVGSSLPEKQTSQLLKNWLEVEFEYRLDPAWDFRTS